MIEHNTHVRKWRVDDFRTENIKIESLFLSRIMRYLHSRGVIFVDVYFNEKHEIIIVFNNGEDLLHYRLVTSVNELDSALKRAHLVWR